MGRRVRTGGDRALMGVSLLVVNYRSSALAISAIRSARAATAKPLQVIVVDNSVDAAEADVLRPHADVLIAAERNLGYSAAINRGRRACDGNVLLVSNPDVVFAPHSIDDLVAVDAPIAGPALYWDDAHEWLLPPADLHTTGDVLDHALATRSPAWRRRRDRRRTLARLAFASLREPTPVDAISGAVMAIRTSVFDDAHGFDERFPLYFEDTDFMRRAGEEITYVPAARCRHVYNQSAGGSEEAARFWVQSEREYLRKWSGALVPSIVKAIERPHVDIAADEISGPIDTGDPESVAVEASPLPSFDTAALHFPRSRYVDLPPEVLSSYRGDALRLRLISRRSGEVLATYRRSKMSSS